MILTCDLCQSQFLTESDPHVVIPGPKTKIYCCCQVKGDDNQRWIDQLKHEHKLYREHLGALTKEIDNLKLEYDKLTDWAAEYVAENAKLRECVEKVVYSYDRPTDMMNSVRQVLKELENNI